MQCSFSLSLQANNKDIQIDDGSVVKKLPVKQEMRVRSLGWLDPLEKEMATHSNILAWGNPMDREAWQATVHRVSKESDMTEQLNNNS